MIENFDQALEIYKQTLKSEDVIVGVNIKQAIQRNNGNPLNLDQVEEATFRMDNLLVAKEMEEASKSSKEIRLATGWERGIDGKFRFEISDVTLKDIEIEIGKEYTIGDIIEDSEILKAYPEFKNYKITFNEDGRNSYRRDTQTFEIDAKRVANSSLPTGRGSANIDEFFRTSVYRLQPGNNRIVAHELTHATQQYEGFYSGGSPQSIITEANRISGIEESDNERVRYNKYQRALDNQESLTQSERRNQLLTDTLNIAEEDQIFLRNSLGMSMSLKPKTKEPILKYKTPQGKVFSTYAEALQNTNEGLIEAGTNTVKGFKALFTIDSNTNIDTPNGLINNLIKSNFLSGKKVENTLITKGNSSVKKAAVAELAAGFIQNKFGKGAAKIDNNFDIEIDNNRINGLIEITKSNGETTSISINELTKKSATSLRAEFGDETAASIIGNNEFKNEFNAPKIEAPVDEEYIPENRLQEKLVQLLKDMGIKTLSYADYAKKYTIKNGIEPTSTALADLVNQVVAFRNGEIREEDLLEETSHFIIAATPKEKLENLLRNVHKTKEWLEFSEQYQNIYGDDALVREEILGKVLANSLKEQFQTRDSNDTENGIIAKLLEIFSDFFNRISEFINPNFEKSLENYTREVYKNLMKDELANKLNKEVLGNRANILYSASSASMSMYVKSKQLLERLLNQQYQLSKRYNNVSDRNLLQQAKEILSAKEDEIEVAEKLKAISNIVMVASSQANVLSKSIEGKDNTGYHFSQEESVVFQDLQKRVMPLLDDLQNELGTSKKEMMLKSEIDKIYNKFREINRSVPNNQNIAFNKIVDRVIRKLELDCVRQPDGTYVGADAFFGQQIHNALTTSQKDTDFFHAHLGSLLTAANPLLNLAGDVIERKTLISKEYFQRASKSLINGLDRLGFDFLKLNTLVKNGYIENERDAELVKKVELEDKVLAYNNALVSTNREKATIDNIESIIEELKKDASVEGKQVRARYNSNYNLIRRERNETYFSEDYLKRLQSFDVEVNGKSITREGLSSAGLKIDEDFRKERRSIKQLAGDNLTKVDEAKIQEIDKRRKELKNPRNSDGEYKAGLTEVYDSVKGRYFVTYDLDKLSSLSEEEREEASIVYALNMNDLITQEFFKKERKDSGEQGIPTSFYEALDKANDEVAFLSSNAYIGYPEDFWNNFDSSSGTVARLRGLKTEEADNLLKQIRKQQALINNILKQNTVYNRPSETNYDEMQRVQKAQVKESASILESLYDYARKLLPVEESKSLTGAENVVNDSYQKALEDSENKNELDFILEHVTSKGRDSIIAAKEVVRNNKSIPKYLNSYMTESMSKVEKEQALIEYAKTKLLPYFKRIEPIGFTEAWNSFREGSITAKDFIARTDVVQISPNFSFYENTDNINKKWLENNRIGKPQYNEKYLKRVKDTKFFDKYRIVDGVATQNVKDWQARELLLEYQKEMIAYNGLTGVQDLYMMPQVRRTIIEKITSLTKKGIAEIWKDITTFRAEEAELGETVDGSEVKLGSNLLTIPTYYNRPLENKSELTDNVLYAYLLYGKEAAEHKARRETISDMLVLSDTLKSTEFANKEADRTNTYKMLQSQIDYNFYGVKESFNYKYRGVDIGKAAKTVNNIFKKFALSGAVVPITSYLTAKTQQTIELLVGQVSNKTAVIEGRKLFYKHAKGATAEIGAFKSNSFFNVIGESLNIYSGLARYENSKYNRATRLGLEGSGLLHSGANFGPIGMAMATVISDLRIVDGKIIDYNRFKQKFEAQGQKGSVENSWKSNELFAPYMELAIKDGVLDFNNAEFVKAISPKLNMGEEELKEYMGDKREYLSQRMLSTIQRVDSQIPEQQKSIWARDARANFFMSFLNFLWVQIPLKFKERQFNISEGEVQVGNYRETWEFLLDNFKDPKKVYENYKNAPPETKLALKRTLIELAVVNALAIAALALSKYVDDDDDTTYPVALADYFLQRTSLETLGSTFALPATIGSVIENPLLIYSKGKDWAKVGDLFNGNADKYLMRVAPLAKDVKKLYDPTEARQSYLYFQEQEAGDLYDRYAWFTNILPEVMQGEE
jgi:hypothetical protein